MTHPSEFPNQKHWSRDKDRIEALIDRERAALAHSLGRLQDRISPDGVTQQVLTIARASAVKHAGTAMTVVKKNPLGFAVMGAGLAIVIFGRKPAPTPDPKLLQTQEWENEGGSLPPKSTLSAKADSLRGFAADGLHTASRLAESAGSLRDFAVERSQMIRDFTADLTSAVKKGLEALPQSAKATADHARETAHAAQDKIETMAKTGSDATGKLVHENPMWAGAVALGLGALTAALLPARRPRDLLTAKERDRLLQDAAELVRDESIRLALRTQALADLAEASPTAQRRALAKVTPLRR